MKLCSCKNCLDNYSVVPRFLISDNQSDAEVIFTEETSRNLEFCQKLGHDKEGIVDSVLKKTLDKYGIIPAENEQEPVVRISCSENDGNEKDGYKIGDIETAGYTIEIVKIGSPAYKAYQEANTNADKAVSIDGKIAVIRILSTNTYRAAENLICGRCHLIIDAKDVVSRKNQYYVTHTSQGYEDFKEYTLTLLAPPYAGKTALLLSVYKNYLENKENTAFESACVEPYFYKYFYHASKRLFSKKVPPPNTMKIQPPLSFALPENRTIIHILDTKGEDTSRGNLEQAKQSDAVIVLFSLKDRQTEALEHTEVSEELTKNNIEEIEKLSYFLFLLEEALPNINNGPRVKPVIMCFTKCDLYADTAEKIMLYTKGQITPEKRRILRMLRNYNFNQNHDKFIRMIYQEITGTHQNSSDSEEYLRNFCGEFSEIFSHCRKISNGAMDLLCIAPMGVTIIENDSENVKEQKKISPRYMDDFMNFIEDFCKELNP